VPALFPSSSAASLTAFSFECRYANKVSTCKSLNNVGSELVIRKEILTSMTQTELKKHDQ
jgi:hypothetical protein